MDLNANLQIIDEDCNANQSKSETATGKFPGQNEEAFQSEWTSLVGKGDNKDVDVGFAGKSGNICLRQFQPIQKESMLKNDGMAVIEG